jgi:hypothetical protein
MNIPTYSTNRGITEIETDNGPLFMVISRFTSEQKARRAFDRIDERPGLTVIKLTMFFGGNDRVIIFSYQRSIVARATRKLLQMGGWLYTLEMASSKEDKFMDEISLSANVGLAQARLEALEWVA